MENCLFCKIIRNEIPAKKVYEDEDILAFFDIHPQREMHILVIPKKHIQSLAHVEKSDQEVLGKILLKVEEIANQNGSKNGFRVIINTGIVGGQEVNHLHAHVLGGEKPVGAMLSRS